MSGVLFQVAAWIAGVLSILVGLGAVYLAWLTRRATAMGAQTVPLPGTGRRMVPPSVAVLLGFAAGFLILGGGLIVLALTR